MQTLLLILRRVLRRANGVVLFDDRLEAHVQKFFRSPFKAFCGFALFGAALTSLAAFVDTDLIFMLILWQGLLFGIMGAAMSGLTRWQAYLCSRGRMPTRRRRLFAYGTATVAIAGCGILSALTEAPRSSFIVFTALLSIGLMTALGVIALLAELVSVARCFRTNARL